MRLVEWDTNPFGIVSRRRRLRPGGLGRRVGVVEGGEGDLRVGRFVRRIVDGDDGHEVVLAGARRELGLVFPDGLLEVVGRRGGEGFHLLRRGVPPLGAVGVDRGEHLVFGLADVGEHVGLEAVLDRDVGREETLRREEGRGNQVAGGERGVGLRFRGIGGGRGIDADTEHAEHEHEQGLDVFFHVSLCTISTQRVCG